MGFTWPCVIPLVGFNTIVFIFSSPTEVGKRRHPRTASNVAIQGQPSSRKNHQNNTVSCRFFFFGRFIFILGFGWPCVVTFVGFNTCSIFFHFPTQQRLENANTLIPVLLLPNFLFSPGTSGRALLSGSCLMRDLVGRYHLQYTQVCKLRDMYICWLWNSSY